MRKTVPLKFEDKIIGTAVIESLDSPGRGFCVISTEIPDPAVRKLLMGSLTLDTSHLSVCNFKEVKT